MAKVEDREAAPSASLNDDIGEEMRLHMYRMQVELREAELRKIRKKVTMVFQSGNAVAVLLTQKLLGAKAF